MINTNRNLLSFVRSAPGRTGRNVLAILPLGLMLSGAGHRAALAQVQAPAPSCAASLDSLMSRWDYIGFAEPSKPSAAVVAGRRGYTTTGGQFHYMVQQIRIAARDCEAARNDEALEHIKTVQRLLGKCHV
jgi:hypothetical protein